MSDLSQVSLAGAAKDTPGALRGVSGTGRHSTAPAKDTPGAGGLMSPASAGVHARAREVGTAHDTPSASPGERGTVAAGERGGVGGGLLWGQAWGGVCHSHAQFQPSHYPPTTFSEFQETSFRDFYDPLNPLYPYISFNSDLLEGIYHYREWEGGAGFLYQGESKEKKVNPGVFFKFGFHSTGMF